MYLLFLFGSCLFVGLVGVAANPAPHYGVVGLVVGVMGGCGSLVVMGGSFVGVVLFLIYLGGMLVVFAYSVALAADPYPETWGSYFVGMRAFCYGGLVVFLMGAVFDVVEFCGGGLGGLDGLGFFGIRGDSSGVSVLFLTGAPLLVLCGWGLLVTLFVILELVRGWVRVGLRVP